MKFFSGSVAAAIAATALAVPAGAATPGSATDIAGDWIDSQLTDGLAIGDYGADIGLTIDAGLALRAIGRTAGAEAVAEAIADRLVATGPADFGYVASEEYDFVEPYEFKQVGRYSNATAKAAAFTQRIGRDPAIAYDDVDLVAQLEDLADDTTGRIADDSLYGDYANTIGQAFAVEALTVAGSTEAEAATGALLAQQCPAGFFRLAMKETVCSDAVDAPNPDVTALAVISLVTSGAPSSAVSGAVAEAVDWLESVQKPDGSFEGDAWTPGSNANSTGLSGWAMGEVGRTTAAGKAAAWVRSVQGADAGACATRAPVGGIAYNAGDLTEARADGVTLKRDAWRRTTFQAAPALSWAPAADKALGISTPATAAGTSTVTAVVSGLDAGEYGCVTLGTTARTVLGTGTDIAVPLELPAAPGSYTVAVTTLSSTQTATTTVPAPAPAPAPAPHAGPAPATPVVGQLATKKVERVKRHRFALDVTCDNTVACAGKLKIRTRRTMTSADGTTRHLLMAKRRYAVEPGETARIRLLLTKPARSVLGSKRLRVTAVQTVRGAEPASATFWLTSRWSR